MEESQMWIYLKFVQQMLDCPESQLNELLLTRPELVNKKLVIALLGMAHYYSQHSGTAMKAKIRWLVSFGHNLATCLGLDLENDDRRISFLTKLLQLVIDSSDDIEIIHSLMRENLDLLDDDMLLSLENWISHKFLQIDEKEQKIIAFLFSRLGDYFQRFPLGNRSTNIELSIKCYDPALKLISEEKDSDIWIDIQNGLANAYILRIRGNRSENVETAIEIFQLLLDICDRKIYFWSTQ